jgi:8-oxo-dGTP diphosphatase
MSTKRRSEDPLDRPVVGVGVVVWRGEKVLLIKRGKEPRRGQWSIPGGSQELGETVREAACREVKEETGLAIDICGLVDVIDGLIRDEKNKLIYHYTLIDFVAHSAEGEPIAGDDAVEAGWFGTTELEALGVASETREVIRKSMELKVQR